ncbi:MAG TPA: hypothetical protein VF024_13055 [Solirubrobacteraceae bacterium]
MTRLFTDVAAAPDPRGEILGLWVRRAVLTIFTAIAVLGLLDVFGQGTTQTAASTPAAVVRVTAPQAVRGGLFFQSRVEIRARRAIAHPRLVLDEGWIEGMQVNSIEPNPMSEASRDGRVVLSYDAIDAGERLVVWLEFEVNPTNTGHRSYGLELDDADTKIATVARHITVFP